jgi:hypothetical protein
MRAAASEPCFFFEFLGTTPRDYLTNPPLRG